MYEDIKELETKIDNAKIQLSKIADTAEDSYENIRNKFDTLYEDIGTSFKKFSNKDTESKKNRKITTSLQEVLVP